MFIALDKDFKKIPIDAADKGNDYFCPICKAQLIVRAGKLNAKHFSHKSGECTDLWHYDMSEWHKRMQSYFNEANREVVVKAGQTVHRADILIDRTVIEFQHSPISATEFCERNEFFRRIGYRIAWVFDATEAFENKSLSFAPNDDRLMLIWKNPNRVFATSEKITDNSKQYAVWLYWPSQDDEIDRLNKVIWTATDEDGNPSLKRFIISGYDIPMKPGEISPDWFFLSKIDYFRTELAELKKKHPFRIKYLGEKGKPRDAYICPKRPTQFGVMAFSEKGCAYCSHCYMIAKQERYGKTKFAMYCCYPTQVREAIEGHPGYECEQVEIFEI